MKEKNRGGRGRLPVLILLILLLAAAAFAAACYLLPEAFSGVRERLGLEDAADENITVINGTTLKGEYTVEVAWPEGARFAVEQGDSFTFDVRLMYTDGEGTVAYEDIDSADDLSITLSDTTLCEATSFKSIKISDSAPDGSEFRITLTYKSGESMSYGFIVYEKQE